MAEMIATLPDEVRYVLLKRLSFNDLPWDELADRIDMAYEDEPYEVCVPR